jgi:hypothetical protein
VDHHVVELDRCAVDFDLEGIESSFRSSYFYVVVIGGAVDVSLTKIDPASR